MLRTNVKLNEELGNKLYFSVSDLAQVLQITRESAKVLASRYRKNRVFMRLKKDFYVLSSNWRKYTIEQYLQIANVLQVPSYISFMTALNYYEITTQVQRNFFESAAQKRTVSYNIDGTVFAYYKLKKDYYFDFTRLNNIFISTKEKAFIDAIYLFSFGKYRLDIDSLDMTRLENRAIKSIIKTYPEKTKRIVRRLCNI
jgi:predicted transcriptional regulator of viral defense system